MLIVTEDELKIIHWIICAIEITAKQIRTKAPETDNLCESIEGQAQIACKIIEGIKARS